MHKRCLGPKYTQQDEKEKRASKARAMQVYIWKEKEQYSTVNKLEDEEKKDKSWVSETKKTPKRQNQEKVPNF
jgi:hypothetical protein